jgi:hypothetical protein
MTPAKIQSVARCRSLAKVATKSQQRQPSTITWRAVVLRLGAQRATFSRRQLRPSFANPRPSKKEGAGNAGRSTHPQPRVQMKKAHERSHHGFTGNTRHSLRNGFTASFVALPGDRLSCHHPQCDAEHRHRVDTSIGVPGPHDFAVRLTRARPARDRRPSHPASNVRDDRETSLLIGRETGALLKVICPTAQAKAWVTPIDHFTRRRQKSGRTVHLAPLAPKAFRP